MWSINIGATSNLYKNLYSRVYTELYNLLLIAKMIAFI